MCSLVHLRVQQDSTLHTLHGRRFAEFDERRKSKCTKQVCEAGGNVHGLGKKVWPLNQALRHDKKPRPPAATCPTLTHWHVQLEGNVLFDVGRAFSEGADESSWSHWGDVGKRQRQ